MRISIIGTGNMGSAIARALSTTDHEVCVFDAVQEKAEELARECETIKLLPSIKSASGSDAVILAVKPQILPGLYQMLREVETDLWISIAAGVPLSVLEDHLGTGNVIRFMPNIAASAKKAVTAIAAGNGVPAEGRELAFEIAGTFGTSYFLPESLFPAFIGISGSGIAFMFEMMHYMALGGVRAGIPYPDALSIVRDTMASAAAAQKSTGKNAIELETMVTSAAGTTIEGVRKLQDGNLGAAVMAAVDASVERSISLENKAKFGDR